VDLRLTAIGSAKNGSGNEWEEAAHSEKGQAR
jgi:hypothetical protein